MPSMKLMLGHRAAGHEEGGGAEELRVGEDELPSPGDLRHFSRPVLGYISRKECSGHNGCAWNATRRDLAVVAFRFGTLVFAIAI